MPGNALYTHHSTPVRLLKMAEVASTIATVITTVSPKTDSDDSQPESPAGGSRQPLYVNGTAFSNPLYFKTAIVGFLGAWPLAIMCIIVYMYNLCNYKNFKVTAKMVFFPVLLFAGIMDNCYDIITGAKVSEYNSTILIAMIVSLSVLSAISLLYLGTYTYESMKMMNGNLYQPLAQEDTMEMTVFSRTGGNEESGGGSSMGRSQPIIDEYMTSNIVWGLTTYTMMLTLIYAARYITHTDNNLIREVDLAVVSAVLLVFIVIMTLLDFFLFRNPANGSVFMHYVIAAVFALNFTVDFQAQVGFCEILTLAAFFVAVFLAVYKMKLFIEIGVPAGKKDN